MREVPLLDDRVGPHGGHELVLLDETAGVPEEHVKRVEDLRPERDDLAVARQAALRGLEAEGTEPVRRRQRSLSHFSYTV